MQLYLPDSVQASHSVDKNENEIRSLFDSRKLKSVLRSIQNIADELKLLHLRPYHSVYDINCSDNDTWPEYSYLL